MQLILDTLILAREATSQVKKYKIDNLNKQYELLKKKEGETIQDMHTRFTTITNEIYSLGMMISIDKVIWKLLSILLESWKSKVKAIIEIRDLNMLSMD